MKASLVILENDAIRTLDLSASPRWELGRSNGSDGITLPLASPIASHHHGFFFFENGVWLYQDQGSTNGTFYNGNHMTGQEAPVVLNNGDVLRIDSNDLNSPDQRGVFMYFTTQKVGNNWVSVNLAEGSVFQIGRDPARCQVVLPLPYISGLHCTIRNTGSGFTIQDAGSLAGTFLNNVLLNPRQAYHLNEKDNFCLCDVHFIFSHGNIVFNTPWNHVPAMTGMAASPSVDTGKTVAAGMQQSMAEAPSYEESDDYILQAYIAKREVPDNSHKGQKKVLIQDVQINIHERSLVALIGGSGAGKSTVMNCLNGMETQGASGQVLFRGENLLDPPTFERLKFLIGSVPQKEVLHENQSVEAELKDAAMLRMQKAPNTEIIMRVNETMEKLKLLPKRKTLISKLSGGERRRVNIAEELVADKILLCLDEPDAGLDPGTKKELFTILRDLAHNQNMSILVIIHDVSDIALFDQIIIMEKFQDTGRLAFSGSPAKAKEYFGCELKDVYEMIEKYPERYVQSFV